MKEEQIRSLKTATIEEKKETVESFGIYELRGFARALGIQSPTTKKREELISCIMEILNSNLPLTPKHNTKGRPYKKLNSIESFLDVVTEREHNLPEIPRVYTYEDIAVFAQETPIFDYQSSELFIMKGVVRFVKKVAYFIDIESNDVVFISTQVFNDLKLKIGDLVEASAYRINESRQCYVKEIISINTYNVDEYKYEENEVTKVIPSITRSVGSSKIILGGRNYSIVNGPLYMDSNIDKILQTFDETGDTIIFLGVNMCFEDREILKKYKNIVRFTSQYDGDYSKDFDKVIDAISLAQRLPEVNKNVVFVIYDIINILNSLDLYFSTAEVIKMFGHLQPSGVIVKKMISLSSAFNTGKDCTNIFICNEFDMNDEFVRNEVLKLSNKI